MEKTFQIRVFFRGGGHGPSLLSLYSSYVNQFPKTLVTLRNWKSGVCGPK